MWNSLDGRNWEKPGHGIYSLAAARTSEKEQSCWGMGKARDREVQIVCMFAEQEAKDAALVLVIHWQWFQRLKEGEEVAMGRGGNKEVIFDGVK